MTGNVLADGTIMSWSHYVGIIKEKDLGSGPRGTGQPTTVFSLDILRLRLQ